MFSHLHTQIKRTGLEWSIGRWLRTTIYKHLDTAHGTMGISQALDSDQPGSKASLVTNKHHITCEPQISHLKKEVIVPTSQVCFVVLNEIIKVKPRKAFNIQ